MGDVERRYLVAGAARPIELREEPDQAPRIVGLAAVFESMSEDLGGFREIIKPTAFDRVIREKQDVRALFNHERALVLGRTTAGTLELRIEEAGLVFEVVPPESRADVVELVRRRDVTGASFSFRIHDEGDIRGDRWLVAEDGTVVREVLDVDVFDVGPVTFPAYQATEVSTRALGELAELRARPPADLVRAGSIPLEVLVADHRLRSSR